MRPTLDVYPISLFLAVHKFPFAAFLWQPGVPRSKKKAAMQIFHFANTSRFSCCLWKQKVKH
jgi:hypothetical protein